MNLFKIKFRPSQDTGKIGTLMEICKDLDVGDIVTVRSYTHYGKVLDERPWYKFEVPQNLDRSIYMIDDWEDKINHPHVFGIMNDKDNIWERID